MWFSCEARNIMCQLVQLKVDPEWSVMVIKESIDWNPSMLLLNHSFNLSSFHPTTSRQDGSMGCVPACGFIMATTKMCPVCSPVCTVREPLEQWCYVNGRMVSKCLHILFGFKRHSKDRLNTIAKMCFSPF